MCVLFMKNFLSPIRATWWVLDSFRLPDPKTFVSYFLDMMYVEFMKNFLLDDSGELLAVLPISAFWAQKHLIPILWTSCTSNSWEIFFRPIRANWWVLDSFRPPEPKNVSLLLSRHHVRRVHEKYLLADSSQLMGVRLISASWAQKRLIPTLYTCMLLFDSFRPPEPKYVWFLLYRHHVRRIHQKFFLADSSERMGVRLISACWAQKRLIPTF